MSLEFLLTALQIPCEAVEQNPTEDRDMTAQSLPNVLGKRLAGTKLGMNVQCPKEIAEQSKVLYPIFKENK